jgi:MoaA/NifB/PqqE/SkfB family radical SAM enzyme
MGCVHDTAEHRLAFYRNFRGKVVAGRVPVNGSIELTGRCNFRCIHCYNEKAGEVGEELSTAQWKDILDQITEAGTLFLLITGGEPLVREDAVEIYRYAVKKGIIVTFFTNASLVNDDLIKVLKKYPPRKVEITMYGASEEMYRRITGRTGVFRECTANIEKLVASKVPVQLKTVVLKDNEKDLAEIRKYAEDLGVRHRFDCAVLPRLNGDKGPISQRLTPEEIVALNLSSDEHRGQWKKLADSMRNIDIPDTLYSCGAAVNSFHIDERGRLSPCLMVGDIGYSLKKGNFMEGWRSKLPALFKKRMAPESKCRNCGNMVFCNYCPATFKLETGSEDIPSRFLCEIGKLMADKIYG